MDVTEFPHQVSGNFGLLTCPGHVCKPLNQCEFVFYLQMDKLLPYAPQFCGRMKVNMCSFSGGALLMCSASVEFRIRFIRICGRVKARHGFLDNDSQSDPRRDAGLIRQNGLILPHFI